jgi:triosephosphate isomerase
MYKGIAQTSEYLQELQMLTQDLHDAATVFIIPSFMALQAARKVLDKGTLLLGAQNMHPQEQGQFTGEISPLMLKELNLDIIEIGHSERRHIFMETDEQENAKVLSALSHEFTALLCIGEDEEQKKNSIADEILRMQLKIGLRGVRSEDLGRIWIAYEPVWAIGVNGKPASAVYVRERHAAIKKVLAEISPGADIPVLYGGSVNPQNADELIKQPGVDGLFVGRAAWDAPAFDRLIRQVLPLWNDKITNNNVQNA